MISPSITDADRPAIEAVVCIPTFRRPDWLERTIASVIGQETEFGFAVVVVDNDGAKSEGAERARSLLVGSAIEHRVFAEPKQGNCHAINRAFSEALDGFPDAEFVLMIDDDEIAKPGWLSAMVDTARFHDADIVGGPVRRRFEVPVGQAIADHPLFISIEGKTRQVDQIHGTGNCLIRRAVFTKLPAPTLDVRFNFLGGGDMEFFTRCRLAGFRSWWCEEAVIEEFVPPERTTAAFLTRRSIRTGSINYIVDRTHMSAPAAVAKTFVSLALGLMRGAGVLVRTGSPLSASHPVLLPLGRLSASIGLLPQPYKAKS